MWISQSGRVDRAAATANPIPLAKHECSVSHGRFDASLGIDKECQTNAPPPVIKATLGAIFDAICQDVRAGVSRRCHPEWPCERLVLCICNVVIIFQRWQQMRRDSPLCHFDSATDSSFQTHRTVGSSQHTVQPWMLSPFGRRQSQCQHSVTSLTVLILTLGQVRRRVS